MQDLEPDSATRWLKRLGHLMHGAISACRNLVSKPDKVLNTQAEGGRLMHTCREAVGAFKVDCQASKLDVRREPGRHAGRSEELALLLRHIHLHVA